MLTAGLLFVHLVCFAAYLGASFAQIQIMKLSARVGTTAEIRNAYEKLCATILTKIEVPALFGSLFSGVVFIVQDSALMKQGWLHGKLLCVLILLVLSHLEMFNARAIVRIRADGGKGTDDEITARKARHNLLGTAGAVVVVALLVLVTFVRLGAFRSG